MAGFVRSARNLWALLAGNSVVSVNVIGQELEKNADWLLSGVFFNSTPNPSSVEQLKKVVDDVQLQFIIKLSKFIDLDVKQCLELFKSYVKYEYKGTQKGLQTILSVERHIQSLLYELWNYYYSERLYSLMIMKHILEHWKDDSDLYKDLYSNFITCINEHGVIIKQIMKQLELMFHLNLPNKDTHGPLMNESLTFQWAMYVLREHCELLHLLLLYRQVIPPCAEEVKSMFSLFQRNGFGLQQSFRRLMNNNVQNFAERIRCLEVLATIQSFQLHLFSSFQENEIEIDHSLVNDEECIKAMDDIIQMFGSHRSHGPILLCWMLLGQCSNSEYITNRHKLGNLALQLGVSEYLSFMLKSKELCEKGAVSETIHSIVYDVLCLLLSQFEIHTLGPAQPLYDIAESVVKFPSIADDFWKQGLDCGVGILLKNSIEMFPYEFSQMINLVAALAHGGYSSSQKVIKCIKNLRVFTELMENTSMTEIVATQNSGVYKLAKGKMLYGDRNLIVPEGTLGILIQEADQGHSIFQWHCLINGWQVILQELNSRFQELAVSIGAANEDSILRIKAVANLVLHLLKSNLNSKEALKHITNTLFSILQRFSTHPSPPLELLAICIEIAAILCKADSTTIWYFIIQMNFIPSMISPSQDIMELVSGICVNMGPIGNLIASKECVFGKYALCTAFLNFMVNISDNLPDFDDSFLACIIYILREIFSSFHKWFYADPQEKVWIGQSCLVLLHKLLSIDTGEKKTLTKVQKVCIFSLFHFEAGQTLLKFVCTGEAVIQQTILKQDSEQGEQVTALIRLSLSVLNRLLLLRRYLPEMEKSLHGKSPLENVLFSTPYSSEQPQVMLTIVHYAFQHNKPRLATLAVQLLKRFAKEFPMLLLACFGSEAKAVRNHFLSRLNSVTEDIRLKVSILEFLTVCISQQPGVIEMFMNIKEQNKEKETEDDDDVHSCLTTVKEIIKQNSENNTAYTQDLLCVAAEFIHALWAGHQGLAMGALKKDPEYWMLFCKSILSEDFESIHPQIFGYVIRTLGLEFFYMSATGHSENPSDGIKQIIKNISKLDRLQIWSQHVNNISPKSDFNASRLEILDRSIIDEARDAFTLYTAWRDFLLVIAKYETELKLNIPSGTKICMLYHILENLYNQVRESNSRLQILLAEAYLMLFHHWKNEFASNSEDTFSMLQQVLIYIAMNADIVHPRVQLAITSVSISFITVHLKDKESYGFSQWVPFVCKLVRRSCLLMDHALKSEEIAGVSKLPTAVVCLLNKLVLETSDWLPVLKTNMTLSLLASVLSKSLKLEAGIALAHAILTFFISVATSSKAAEALYNTGFMAEITLILSVIKLETASENKVNVVLPVRRKVTTVSVYYAFLRLVSVLLKSLGNYFLQDALNFVGVHLENLLMTFNQVKKNPLSANLEDAILTCTLIHQLSHHQEAWSLEHSKSLDALLNSISFCAHATISLCIRPTLLKHLIENYDSPLKKKLFSNPDGESSKLTRFASTEDDVIPTENVVEIQNKLLELLAICLATIHQYSPGMCEIISDNRMGHGQWQLLFQLNFGTPNIDQDNPVSFGAMLACINICLRWLSKSERTPSPGQLQECNFQLERHKLMYVLEVCLTLLLAQGFLALKNPQLNKREKQLLRRELGSELNMIVQLVNRYLRRGPLSPAAVTNVSSPGQPKTQYSTYELPYIKLINSLMEQFVK